MSGFICDGHVHFGELDRFPDLRAYVTQLGLDYIALVSLPLVGVGGNADILINFNPEVLAGCALLRSCADQGSLRGVNEAWGFGSLDNRALLDGRRSVSGWDPARQVEELFAAGFSGLKLWEGKPLLQRTLGITLDHPALIDAYRVASSFGMPVLAHVADPPSFWNDGNIYADEDVSEFEEFIRQAEAVCDAAPETTWIFPHLLFLAGLGARLPRFLDAHPRAYVDLAPGTYFYTALAGADRVGIPREPDQYRTAREFFIGYRDRIITGSDAFFLPTDLPVVPGTPLADNLERFLRLRRFLEDARTQVSPFTGATQRPLFLGLDLAHDRATAETLTPILGGNMYTIMSSIQRSSSPDPVSWLERWTDTASGPAARERARRVREIFK
jgi:hypothetical protein